MTKIRPGREGFQVRLIDSHSHLHFPEYDGDRSETLARARQAGVEAFISVGTDLATSEACLRLAEQEPFIFATAGLHPHDAVSGTEEVLKGIEDLLGHPRVVAVGEVGLDFFRDHSPHDVQQRIFHHFLDLAEKTEKPLVIHCRDAYDPMLGILRERKQAPYRGVMHCFSSDAATMKCFLDLGFHISFAGPLTYRKNDALREACRVCPADRLLLETDAPYLAPQKNRGKRNEPAFMTETAGLAAELKGMTSVSLGEQTVKNTKELFGL